MNLRRKVQVARIAEQTMMMMMMMIIVIIIIIIIIIKVVCLSKVCLEYSTLGLWTGEK